MTKTPYITTGGKKVCANCERVGTRGFLALPDGPLAVGPYWICTREDTCQERRARRFQGEARCA